MENTVRDFWKMIVDYKVSAIVMLCGLEENGEVNDYFYYNCIEIFITRSVAINTGHHQLTIPSLEIIM